MNDAILPMPPYDWQQADWEQFCQRINDGKLPHAFILAGQEGIGVEDLAMAMGQYLLCLSPMNNIACGRCRGCQLINAGTHPDLLYVSPESKGKPIKIDQIRELAGFVDQTAQQGGYKIIVLSPAETMNINAANALLKNLEEPAGKTIFLLTSSELNQVLPTIRSRCAKMMLYTPKAEQALAWLNSVGVEDAVDLLSDVRGAPLLAKQWSDEGTDKERLEIVEDLTAILNRNIEPMAFAKKWSKLEPMKLLEPMMTSIDVTLASALAGRVSPKHYLPLIESISHCPADFLFRLRDRFGEKKQQFLASPNLNAALFIEELALDWAAVLKAA